MLEVLGSAGQKKWRTAGLNGTYEPAQGAASLAAPAIPFEDLLVQPALGISTQPNPAAFCWGRFHAAFVAA